MVTAGKIQPAHDEDSVSAGVVPVESWA